MQIIQIIQIIVGLALLAVGRKGVPLLLAAVGFFAGFHIVTQYFEAAPQGVLFGVALAGAVIGLFLAFFIQKIAVAVGGLLVGGYFGYLLAMQFGWEQPGFPWITVGICAVLGILLAYFLLKWALIVLSSVLGAVLVVNALGIQHALGGLVFVVLLSAGIIFQARSGTAKKSE